MTMSAHNTAGPVCHMACCEPKGVLDCCCWMCSPDTFPWGDYDSVEEAAADWGTWYSGKPCPPSEEPDPEEEERIAEWRRGLEPKFRWLAGSVRPKPKGGRR